ncbi:MAG: SDR family oxidoreductase [Chloroflexi bacterium]|nr:SDR family oxidoreductase [Chloroflexota bacterium]
MPVPPEWDLTGRVALLNTTVRADAPSLAAALAEAGADVAIVARSPGPVEEAVAAVRGLGRRALGHVTDTTSPDAVNAATDLVLNEFGRVDILVNNVQATMAKPFLETPLEDLERVMRLNWWSALLFCRQVGRHMVQRGSGRVVNITSALGDRGHWNFLGVCASAAAVTQLTRVLALEWGRADIRVNGIGIGWQKTQVPPSEEAQQRLVRYLLVRRLAEPGDVAALLVYLCSPACDYITGHTFFIDGGAHARA